MSYNPYSLESKTILITGASSGIGQATATECSKMGAKLIITGRDETRLLKTFNQLKGEGHKYVIADLVTEEGIEKLIAEVDTLNGLVLCAGKGMTIPIQFKYSFGKVAYLNYGLFLNTYDNFRGYLIGYGLGIGFEHKFSNGIVLSLNPYVRYNGLPIPDYMGFLQSGVNLGAGYKF